LFYETYSNRIMPRVSVLYDNKVLHYNHYYYNIAENHVKHHRRYVIIICLKLKKTNASDFQFFSDHQLPKRAQKYNPIDFFLFKIA